MVSPSRLAFAEALVGHDRLLEVGIGDRPEVGRLLADRGRDVVAIDVAVGERALAAAEETDEPTVTGSLRVVEADVLDLAEGADGEGRAVLRGPNGEIDAVYACNLPAELQPPTVALAARLDAACLFTTLGFEEPAVPVRRRSLSAATVYVARDGAAGNDSPRPTGGR